MNYKQVLIVYKKSRERAARRTESEIGLRAGHKASLKPEKDFKSSQTQIPTTQPLLFVGMSKAAGQLKDVTPVVFSSYGATCRLSGRRAILTCEWPDDLQYANVQEKAKQIAEQIKAFTAQEGGFALASKIPEAPSVAKEKRSSKQLGLNDQAYDVLKTYSGFGPTEEYLREKNIRDRYVELLYLYAASRFVAEYLDDFASAS